MSLGIYIHWPFCLHKCPYCDFNSHVSKTIDHSAWAKAYIEEIDKAASHCAGTPLTSIYFGGGTPSTAAPATIAAIVDRIASYWPIDNAEITLEANPTSVEAENFAAFASAGVNRVSIGFQALNDRDLKRLGRMHSRDEALAALDTARRYFSRTNFDLIYARQNQSLADWQSELDEALALSPDHLSLYQLTIEEGTVFAARFAAGQLSGLPSDESAATQYQWTSEYMRAHGFSHYEISNFAREGEESRHNLLYWHGDDYIGIGPGAHGRLTIEGNRIATSQTRDPKRWLAGERNEARETLTARETAEEYLMMSLRLAEGTSRARLAALGLNLPAQALADLSAHELIWQSNSHIGTTDQGRLLLNAILRELLV